MTQKKLEMGKATRSSTAKLPKLNITPFQARVTNFPDFVMSTINKLPHVKPDLVQSDDDWEEWYMEVLITN